MRTPLVLLILSLACSGISIAAFGQQLTLPLAISLLAAIAAGFLALKAGLRRAAPALPQRQVERPQPLKSQLRSRRNRSVARKADTLLKSGALTRPEPRVVVDGSNVMHWNGKVPRLDTLQDVLAQLQDMGYRPGVIFDANAGYKLGDRYLDDKDFAKLLNLPGDCVVVVRNGEPADPTILAAARELNAKVITNDRFRDWAKDFPEVAEPGTLIKGGYKAGTLWLDDSGLVA